LPIRVGPLSSDSLPVLWGLWFNDENTGWFCGLFQAMRTIDGCKTIIDSMDIDDELKDVHFKNSTTGIMVGYEGTFRTTNAGKNWYQVQLPINNFSYPNANRVTFVGDTGWTAGSSDVVYRTTNYGISWDSISQIPIGPSQGTRCIEFSSAFTGFAGGDYGKIFKSTDGGYTWWIMQTMQFGPGAFASIYSYNDSVVWAVGGDGGRYIIQTTNGGGLLLKAKKNFSKISEDYELFQNYPNPFNPNTNIQYDLPRDNFVSIKVYDLLGKEVMTLTNDFKEAGSYVISFNGNNLSSGIYYYKIKAGDFEQVRKMILIK